MTWMTICLFVLAVGHIIQAVFWWQWLRKNHLS